MPNYAKGAVFFPVKQEYTNQYTVYNSGIICARVLNFPILNGTAWKPHPFLPISHALKWDHSVPSYLSYK